MLYNKYSDFLKMRYGEKVYKLPVCLPVSCPNRDGAIAVGGCAFCGAAGAAHETLSPQLPVTEQLLKNREYIGRKYGARKYLAYFQEYTNTYMPPDRFKRYLSECSETAGIVGVVVSTRPDCLDDSYLEILNRFRTVSNLDIYIEIGLQTANWHTLEAVNRGHGLAEFIDAVIRAHSYSVEVCAHVIPNLPGDNPADVIETARIISALNVEQVKLHALYIARGSQFASEYAAGKLKLVGKEEYIERVILFLRNLKSNIVVQRLIGRVPESDSLFANWGESWWKIHAEIETRMQEHGWFQGESASFGQCPVVD